MTNLKTSSRARIARKIAAICAGQLIGCGLSALLVTFVFACSSTDGEPEATATGGQTSTGGSGSGDPSALIGTFQVQLAPANPSTGTAASTRLVGKVSDGPTPPQIIWAVSEKAGDCVLEKPRVPFCDPSCGAGVCVDDDECQDYPLSKSVGSVTVTGVANSTGAAFTMEPVAGNYQPPAGLTLTHPGFDEDSTIGISTSGGDLAPFTIQTKGIRPLELSGNAIPLESGKPLALAWAAARDPQASTIHVKLDISHHGGTKGMIQCDVADTGAFEVPAALVTKLLGLGVAGFPTVVVTRKSAARAQTALGAVELYVESPVERSVTVPGLVSCDGDEDCSGGQSCRADLSCG